MTYQTALPDEDLVRKAEQVHPTNWEDIQNLIDITEDVRVKVKLEKIMITKFHEEEAINEDL